VSVFEGSPIIKVSGLTRRYGDLTALNRASFSVGRGELFGYLGPNGAGKTTTINILCGLLDRHAGEATICGIDVERDPVAVKQRIGLAPEESNLYPELSCRRNLEYLGELYGLSRTARRAKAGELLGLFDLAEKEETPFRALSRGMKRRVTVAAALVHSPEVVFLDEPTAGLDVPSAQGLRALIRDINQAGTTIFLTTHNLVEAQALCDRVLILVKGKVVAEGTTKEIQKRVEKARTLSVEFSGDVAAGLLRSACSAIQSTSCVQGVWHLKVCDTHTALTQVVSFAERENLHILEVSTTAASLEEAFLTILEDAPSSSRGDGV